MGVIGQMTINERNGGSEMRELTGFRVETTVLDKYTKALAEIEQIRAAMRSLTTLFRYAIDNSYLVRADDFDLIIAEIEEAEELIKEQNNERNT